MQAQSSSPRPLAEVARLTAESQRLCRAGQFALAEAKLTAAIDAAESALRRVRATH